MLDKKIQRELKPNMILPGNKSKDMIGEDFKVLSDWPWVYKNYEFVVDYPISEIDEISINEKQIGKVIINKKYPFALIKFNDENFNFDKKLNCGSGSIKTLKPVWLK